MPTLFVKNIELLAAFDDARREIRDGTLFMGDNLGAQVSANAQLARVSADRVVDLSRHVALPGIVNTHHHRYQNLTGTMVQDELVVWLTMLYPISAKPDDEAIDTSARVTMAELMLSGCTTDRHAMTRIIPAPCVRFSVTPGEMKEAARLARSHPGVHLHSHLTEDLDQETLRRSARWQSDWKAPHSISGTSSKRSLTSDASQGASTSLAAN
jgi:cytosine/adenosine deaminase-related metal-dependent hydrolase